MFRAVTGFEILVIAMLVSAVIGVVDYYDISKDVYTHITKDAKCEK